MTTMASQRLKSAPPQDGVPRSIQEPASVLVVDDQDDIQFCTEQILTDEGYRVLTASDGLEALRILETQPVSLILADIAMPRMNGYQFHAQVVSDPRWVAIPFVFLTARALDSDIRYGKELGVDDYIVKPFDPDDLVATVRGKLRRAQQLQASAGGGTVGGTSTASLKVGVLSLDLDRHTVELAGQPVKLTAKEFTLLAQLARCEGCVVSVKALVESTHGLHTDAQDASALLRPLIRTLRRKLGYPAGEMGCIRSVRSVGYKLIALDREAHL